MQASDLFAFPESMPFRNWFAPDLPPWEWVSRIAPALAVFPFASWVRPDDWPPGLVVEGPVFIGSGVRLPPFGLLRGPAWIGDGCELRPGVYLRGQVIAGPGSVLGNSCEYKNCLLLERVETSHFNYVGDSVLGNGSHLGAGVVCANLKLARDEVQACTPEGRVATGRRKLGALVGDGAEAACNAVLQPGTILGPRSAVLTPSFHGYLPPDTLVLSPLPRRLLKRPRMADLGAGGV